MKRFFIFWLVVLELVCSGLVVEADDDAKEKPKKPESICPVTKISDNDKCLNCHIVTAQGGKAKFGLKECDPHAGFDYPHSGFKFREDEKGRFGYFVCTEIDSVVFGKVFDYLKRHDVKRLTLELQTPGGSIMQMWRIIGQMDEFKAGGGEITCIVKGFCASAGFILLNNASPGRRFVAPNAEIMWHEVQSLKVIFGFQVDTPSDKEDEARILRHFQDNGNAFLAKKSKLSKDQIDEKVRKREWWMTGFEAVRDGFADKLL